MFVVGLDWRPHYTGFVVVCMGKLYSGYDDYSSIINSKECHNDTVNLLLPTLEPRFDFF